MRKRIFLFQIALVTFNFKIRSRLIYIFNSFFKFSFSLMSIEFFLSLLRTKSTDEHFRFQFESLVFFWLKIRSRLFHRIIQLVFKFSFLPFCIRIEFFLFPPCKISALVPSNWKSDLIQRANYLTHFFNFSFLSRNMNEHSFFKLHSPLSTEN